MPEREPDGRVAQGARAAAAAAGQAGGGGAARGFWGGVWAALRQRCPRCRAGKMFRGPVTMNDPCPVCGLLFQREEGYFLGAMYFSYLLSAAVLGTTYFVAAALFPGLGGTALVFVAMLPLMPLLPAVFRYSRVLWVHFDRLACPADEAAGSYEKNRLRQLARRQNPWPGRGGPARPA